MGRGLLLREQRGGVDSVVTELGKVFGAELVVEDVRAVDEARGPDLVLPAEVEECSGTREAREAEDQRFEASEPSNAEECEAENDQQPQYDSRSEVGVELHRLRAQLCASGACIFLVGLVYAYRQSLIGLTGRGLRNLIIMLGGLLLFMVVQGYLQYAPMTEAAAISAPAADPSAHPSDETQRPSIGQPVDYAVMERARRVRVVPLDAGWDDVGSWDAAARLVEQGGKPDRGVVFIDSAGSAVFGGKRVVALVDVPGVAVVDTPDALLIVSRESSERVREVLAELRRRRLKDLL